jgi:UDP-N-acetyl-D-glucosamine dehydrogenase
VTTVVVVGLGYVGLPLAMRAAEVGHQVVGYDTDEARVKLLEAGESYIEDVSSGDLKQALESGRFRASTDSAACAGFDVAVVAAPTPLRDGLPDLTYLEAASRTLAAHLRPGAAVVVESTSYPGTTQEKVLPLLEEGSGLVAGRDFYLGFSPERIDPGNSTWTLVTTPKIVSGIDAESLRVIKAFYDTVVQQTVVVSTPREAELAKLVENTFRHVNIALVNELAMFAHDMDINVWESIEAASSKPFGFMPFTPGPGVGGALPADRPVLPVLAGGARARQELPVRRAGRRHQPAHAGLRGAQDHDVVQRPGAPGPRGADPAARAGVQEEHRGRPGIPCGPGGPAADSDGRAVARG